MNRIRKIVRGIIRKSSNEVLILNSFTRRQSLGHERRNANIVILLNTEIIKNREKTEKKKERNNFV